MAKSPFRVLPQAQLTDEERVRRDELLRELTSLRSTARRATSLTRPSATRSLAVTWRFPPDQDITIVCSALPPGYLEATPYTNPEAPDYVDLYRFADLDALLELFGHLRAANPAPTTSACGPPTSSSRTTTPATWCCSAVSTGTRSPRSCCTASTCRCGSWPGRARTCRAASRSVGGELFAPVLRKVGDNEILVEDVAHFFRAPSPLNDERTVTICNGSYARGTLGAVRALTDARFRDRNEDYLRTRFADQHTFSIISRVKVVARRRGHSGLEQCRGPTT